MYMQKLEKRFAVLQIFTVKTKLHYLHLKEITKVGAYPSICLKLGVDTDRVSVSGESRGSPPLPK